MIRADSRLVFAAAAFAALMACSRHEHAAQSSAADASDAPVIAETAPAQAVAGAAADEAVQVAGVDAGQLASDAVAATAPGRRFVRTADASFQVADVYAAALAIEDAAAAAGGFVVSNAIATRVADRRERRLGRGRMLRLSEVVTEGSLVVRVPGDRMQAFLRAIARQMQFLDARTFEARDVQFDLLRRQLAHARAQALQRDIGAIGAQPGRIGEKAEAVQAREALLAARDEAAVARRELEDRIAFGTLTLALSQPAQVREQTVPDTEAILRERGPGFFSELGQALQAGWRGLLAALLGIARLWPLWLVAGALVLPGWRALRARRGAGALSPPSAPG